MKRQADYKGALAYKIADLVVSGSNHDANLGLAAITVSLCSKKEDYFDTAQRVSCDIIVNRVRERHRAGAIVESKDPYEKTIYWYGKSGSEQEADFDAVQNVWCSVTPVFFDMIVHKKISKMNAWLNTEEATD